jgi:hypothetical protein
MLSFKNFLVEAKFSEDDFARVLSAFERRLPKLLGAKLYRDGGPGHVNKVAGFDAYTYFFGDRALQVRVKAGHVHAIDVWDKFALNAGTLLGAMKEIARLIKSPEEGKIEVKAINESLQLDEMAKRVGDDSFFKMMVDEYGEAGARDVTWAQIKTVADKNDVLIPAYIRGQKTGRGKWNAEPGAVSGGDEGEKPVEKSGKKDPILYIKVTAQDPETKRFIPAGDSKQAQQLYSQLQGALKAGPTEAEVKDPETLYGHMSQLVEMACKGTLRSLLIYGGPGTGKTYTIMKTVQQMGLTKGKDYQKLSGKATPAEIYKTLFMFRDGGLVIFDDLDSMWGNQDATNVLKAALDTSPVREISWVSSNTVNVSKMDDDEREAFFKTIDDQISSDPSKVRYPSSFDFTGRVIFISNLKKEEFDTAILSRSAKINMDLTPAQILQRMRKILPSLGGDDVSIERKEELLDHLLVMHGRKEITAVTMREFTKGLDIVRSGVPNWKELIQYA